MTNGNAPIFTPELGELLNTPEPPGLGPRRRAGTLSVSVLDAKTEAFLSRAARVPQTRELIRSMVYLWHDHLDESHEISQRIEDADGSFLHGIMHRREPDYWNSKYWFRRAGQHECFPALALAAGEFLSAEKASGLAARLIPGGNWDAFAFVDACEAAARKPDDDALPQQLIALQRIEFNLLLGHFASGLQRIPCFL